MKLSKEMMLNTIAAMGLKKRYQPYQDNIETEVILLTCRKPATIDSAGDMNGSEIDIYNPTTIRVWTSQLKKANKLAKDKGFRIRVLDGEAELFVPADRADEFLHGLGAKARKQTSPEARAVMSRRCQAMRAENAAKTATKTP